MAPSALGESPDALEPVETSDEEGNEGEGRSGRTRSDPSTEPVTEFSCCLEAQGVELGGGSICMRGGGGSSELHQYDGLEEEEEEEGQSQNGLDCFLKPKIPAVSVMDRLTEIHGSQALSFSSALAAQVAARSHSLIHMEEQTFGDEDEEEEEEGNRQTPEKDWK